MCGAWDGYANFGGNLVPKAIMQGIRFNGDGTTFNTFGTVNIGGTIIFDATGGVGTYTVAADCTGTLSITDGPSFNMYVGPGAQQLWITQIGGGPGGTGCRNGNTREVRRRRIGLPPVQGCQHSTLAAGRACKRQCQ